MLVFPTPEASYNWQSSSSDLIYIPRFSLLNDKDREDKHENIENENVLSSKINLNNANIKDKNNDLIEIRNDKFKNEEIIQISNDVSSNLYFPITDSLITHIPCMFLKSSANYCTTAKFALFFHGNAEDINLAFEILNHIRYSLNINVIAPEYPGYGIYSGRPSQEGIFEDTLIIYDYLTINMKIPKENILIFGRSLGTSPSTFLASRKDVAGLILISPMLSIKTVVKDILGKYISLFMKDRFENKKMISHVKCPILIIHGQNDVLINYSHSTELFNLSKAPCELILPENMDHNEFDFFQEFSEPLLEFMSSNAIFAYCKECTGEIPKELFIVPESFKQQIENWNFLTKLLKKFAIN